MPTLVQIVVRIIVITIFTIVASAYAIARLVFAHWRAYRRLPRDASCVCALFRRSVHKRPDVLDAEGTWRHAFLQLSEIRMHYVESGDTSKQLMVCLHGFPQFWYSYRYQLRHFSDRFRVIALDLRGYGETDKPNGVHNYDVEVLGRDVAEAIQQLSDDAPVILMGHDWGGIIAWHVAIRRAELVSRLVILNAPHPKAYLKVVRTSARQIFCSWYMFLFQCPLLAEFFISSLDFSFVESIFYSRPSGFVNPQNFTADDFAAWKYTFSQSGALTPPLNYYRAAARAAGGLQYSAELIRPRVLIVWGELDSALEVQCAELSVTLCRDARIERIPNASHWVQEDVPELVNRYIDSFLKEPDDE